jgi:hypothetical protein
MGGLMTRSEKREAGGESRIANLKSKIPNDERGQSITVMLILLIPLLVLVIGLVYDLGNVAAAQTIAQDVADLAAQDAAKQIDEEHFAATQEVILTPDAIWYASFWVDYMTGGAMDVTSLYTTPDGQVVLEGEVTVRTRLLGMIGLPTIQRHVTAVARPRFGAQREGD